MTGYFQVPRGMMEAGWVGDEPFTRFQAWIWLIENAAFKQREYDVLGRTVKVDRGQICVSLRQLSNTWKWNKSRVERFIARLETETLITTRTEASRTVICVTEYDTYQGGSQPDEQRQLPLTETLSGQDEDSNRDIKESRNKEIRSEDIAPAKPKARRSRYFVEGEPMHPDFRRIASAYSDFDLEAEWEDFRDWHLKSNKPTASMGASASTWMRNAVRFGRARPRQEQAPLLGIVVDNTGSEAFDEEAFRWRNRCQMHFVRGMAWDTGWGPAPGQRWCEVPAKILAEFADRQAVAS